MVTESELHAEGRDFDREHEDKVLSRIKNARIITNIYRTGVYPDWNMTGTINNSYRGEFASLSTAQLFMKLGISQEKLKEVYAFGNFAEHGYIGVKLDQEGFLGTFAPNGKQALSNILDKPIEFFHQPTSSRNFDLYSREVYVPTKKAPK